MHARGRLTLTAAFAFAFLLVGVARETAPAPAQEEEDPGCVINCGHAPPVSVEGGDLVGEISAQVETLNSGSAGGGGSGPPPSCEWEDRSGEPDEDGNYPMRDDGEPRWGLMPDFSAGDADGSYYVRECWHEDMGGEQDCGDDEPIIAERCGTPMDTTWCGAALCYFDQVNPENLALFAVDQFVETLEPPEPQFSPPGGMTLVNFDTWMWVENIPDSGEVGPLEMSVPGQAVTTTASLNEVLWQMGDGETVPCPLTTDETSAEQDCTYSYERSSAGEPNDSYDGTVAIVWLAEYEGTYDGGPISGEIEAPRSEDFELAVAESQAVVTR